MIWPLLRPTWVSLSPGTGLFCTKPMPLRKPLAETLPNGPASKTAGGRLDNGPDIEGAERGAGGGGSAGLAAWSGAFCAPHTEASASPSTQMLIFCNCVNRIILLRVILELVVLSPYAARGARSRARLSAANMRKYSDLKTPPVTPTRQ